MIIAIEGIDSAGKTTIGKALATRLKFDFAEKELRKILDVPFDKYISIVDALKTTNKKEVMSIYYSLNNLLCSIKGTNRNVVVARYIATNYFWWGTEANECIYDAILSVLEKPILTVILKAQTETLRQRVLAKEPKERIVKELAKVENNNEFVPKTKSFLERKGLEYIIIDNDTALIEDVVDGIINKLNSIDVFT